MLPTSQLQRQQLILYRLADFVYLYIPVMIVPVAWSDHSIVDPYINASLVDRLRFDTRQKTVYVGRKENII